MNRAYVDRQIEAIVNGLTIKAPGDRLLVKDQIDAIQNGIYIVTQVGTGSTPFILTRSTDGDNFDPGHELKPGVTVFANEGTSNITHAFLITEPSVGDITIGTTPIQFRMGSISATSVTLSNPLPISSGGTGATSLASGYVRCQR